MRLLLRGQQGQQKDDGDGADDLFPQLHPGGKAHGADAVELVFLEVFHAGEQQHRQQQDQPQLGASVSQQPPGDEIRLEEHRQCHRQPEGYQPPQAGGHELAKRQLIFPGVVF